MSLTDLSSLRDFFTWDPPEWESESLCKDVGVEGQQMFFPQRGRGQTRKHVDIYGPGKCFCRNCPVRWDCLVEFLDEPEGVFGGTDPKQREEIKTVVLVRSKSYIKRFVEERYGG